MSLIVIGGQASGVGKTSVAAALIAAFPDPGWTAIKLSHLPAGECPVNGPSCGCAQSDHPCRVFAEADRSARTDSSRFLAAGAARSFWIRVKYGQVAGAVPLIRHMVESDPPVIVESNSIVGFLEPDLYMLVLRYDVEDFKASARRFLHKADAAVLVASGASAPLWRGVRENALKGMPLFQVTPPNYLSDDLTAFISSKLGGGAC